MTQTRYNHLINSHRGLGAATLRDIIIPALLGTETEGILYWIGKDLAREYPVATEEELIVLTNQLGMGELSLKKRSATQQIWELGGPIVDERLTLDKETTLNSNWARLPKPRSKNAAATPPPSWFKTTPKTPPIPNAPNSLNLSTPKCRLPKNPRPRSVPACLGERKRNRKCDPHR